jgi:hypothetical protein
VKSSCHHTGTKSYSTEDASVYNVWRSRLSGWMPVTVSTDTNGNYAYYATQALPPYCGCWHRHANKQSLTKVVLWFARPVAFGLRLMACALQASARFEKADHVHLTMIASYCAQHARSGGLAGFMRLRCWPVRRQGGRAPSSPPTHCFGLVSRHRMLMSSRPITAITLIGGL